MHKIAAALLLVASPAFATGLEITVEGEGANGVIVIDLLEDVAPNHVERITTLAEQGAFDGVAFHRVIEGFMAQTGDVACGVPGAACPAGTGGSDLPNLEEEFSDLAFDRGVVGMARSQDPDTANSQFFIMFDEGHFLNGQYTVVGRVTDGRGRRDQARAVAVRCGDGAAGRDAARGRDGVERIASGRAGRNPARHDLAARGPSPGRRQCVKLVRRHCRADFIVRRRNPLKRKWLTPAPFAGLCVLAQPVPNVSDETRAWLHNLGSGPFAG